MLQERRNEAERQSGESLPAAGIRIARSGRPVFEIALESQGADDYADLTGPDIGRVMRQCGWHYAGRILRVDALVADHSDDPRWQPHWRVVGSAWAGLIETHTRRTGFNLSYAIGPLHRGKGLATILSCCAALELGQIPPRGRARAPSFVNIQARSSNTASLAAARALGVPECPDAGFRISPREGADIQYLGFREPLPKFLARALAHVEASIPGYDPGCLERYGAVVLNVGVPSVGCTDVDEELGLTDSAPRQ